MVAVDGQRAALDAVVGRFRSHVEEVHEVQDLFRIEGSTGRLMAKFHRMMIVSEAELIRLAIEAAESWQPGEPDAGIPGAKTHLVSFGAHVNRLRAQVGEIDVVVQQAQASAAELELSDELDVSSDPIFERLTAEVDAWQVIAKPLMDVIAHYSSFLTDRFVDSITDAVSNLDGSTVRITEHVLDPSGTITVVRDDVIDNNASSDDDGAIGTVDEGEAALLGLDAGGVAARWDAICREQMTEIRRDLTRDPGTDIARLRVLFDGWVAEQVSLNVDAQEALGWERTGNFLAGMSPGSVHALRTQNALALLRALEMTPPHDPVTQTTMTIARLLLTARPFFTQRSVIEVEAPGTAAAVLPAPACLLFLDGPATLTNLPDSDELRHLLGWILIADAAGHPEPVCVLLFGIPAERVGDTDSFRLVVGSVNDAPLLGDTTRRAVGLLDSAQWITAQSYVIPPKPGRRRRRAIKAHAGYELKTGALAQVRRTGE